MSEMGRSRRRYRGVVATTTALLCLLLGACGGSSRQPRSTTSTTGRGLDSHSPIVVGTVTTSLVPAGQRLRDDGDADNPADGDGNGDEDGAQDRDDDRPTAASYRFPDRDDKAALSFGRPARGAKRRAIAAAVGRYYAAARAGDGKAACALLQSSLAGTVVQDYAGGAGPGYLRSGRSCAGVLSLLFAHYRPELASPVTVVRVGVEGPRAAAVVGSRTLRVSRVFLVKVGRVWRVQSLFGVPLP
jgi:hypothetical protein